MFWLRAWSVVTLFLQLVVWNVSEKLQLVLTEKCEYIYQTVLIYNIHKAGIITI